MLNQELTPTFMLILWRHFREQKVSYTALYNYNLWHYVTRIMNYKICHYNNYLFLHTTNSSGKRILAFVSQYLLILTSYLRISKSSTANIFITIKSNYKSKTKLNKKHPLNFNIFGIFNKNITSTQKLLYKDWHLTPCFMYY